MIQQINTYFAYQFGKEPSDEALRKATKIMYQNQAQKVVSVWDNLQIIAHRGVSGSAPENTLASIRKALEFPEIDAIEIDIHLSKDGEIIVIHDADLQRTTDKKGKIQALSLAEIRAADAGSWFDKRYAGEKVPTLSEVLELVQNQTKLLIEIKQNGTKIYPEIIRKTIAEIRKYQAEKWCIIQSFQSDYLEESYQIAPEIEIQKLVFVPFFLPDVQGTTAVNADFRFWNRQRIQKVHQQNRQTFVYTLNGIKAIKRAILMGVDGIITNYPDKVIALKKVMTNR